MLSIQWNFIVFEKPRQPDELVLETIFSKLKKKGIKIIQKAKRQNR